MKPIWHIVGGLLLLVSIGTGGWRMNIVGKAPEAVKQTCADDPINLDPKQYSNCIIRRM